METPPLARVAYLVTVGLAVPLAAQEPDWSEIPYIRHAAYQAVDALGAGTFPVTEPIRMRGMLIHWPGTMLHTGAGFEPFLGGQWQQFVQAADADDFGGTALWVGQYYGHLPFIGDPDYVYTDDQWRAELDRLSHDPLTGRLFRPGDQVEVRARAPGLFHNGKTNINEQHSIEAAANFDLVLLQAGSAPPEPQTIALSAVKDAADHFIFDATRADGVERLQGTLVQIREARLIGGTWGPGQQMTIADSDGRTLPVHLGLGSGFTVYEAPAEPCDVIGILDQEDSSGSDGYMSGYYIWVMDYDGSRFVLYRYVRSDFDRDGDVDLIDFGHLKACALGPAIPQSDPACRDADLNSDGSVDQIDFAALQRCLSGAERLADALCDQ